MPNPFYSSGWQDRGALPLQSATPQTNTQQPQDNKPKRSGFLNFLPMATSIIGGIGGSFLAPGVGTAAGGAAGGVLGEWLAQKLSGEDKDGVDKGNLVEEGAFGALGGLGKAFKAGRAATTAVRAGEGVSDAAKILRFGAPVAGEVAEQGAKAVAKGGAKNWLSSKLLGAADDTALRASKLSGKQEALKGFKKRFGEDLGAYLRKNNLIGKGAGEVTDDIIKPLSAKYGDEVAKIGRDITSSDVIANNKSVLSKLLKSSSSDNKQLTKAVKQELMDIFEGGSISPKKLAMIKSEYQDLARNAYKLGADPARSNVNKEVAKILKNTLQGVSGSDELAKIGKSLDKAFKASDLLASAAEKGRGTLSLGLTDLLAAGGGGVVGGGIPGAVTAVAGKRAFNSPQVQSFLAKQLASTGEKLVAGGGKKVAQEVVEQGTKAAAKQTAKGMIKAQTAPRLLQMMGNTGLPQPEGAGGSDMSALPTGAPNDGGSQSNSQQADYELLQQVMQADQAPQSPYSRENMVGDIQRDPKNAQEYMALYEMLNPESQQEPLTLSDSAITKTTDAEKALQGLDELDQIISGDFAGGVVQGNLRKLNPFDSNFKTQQASIDRIKQIVGKALEGGVLRKEDEEKYKKILPTMQDNPDVAKSKVEQLRSMLSQDMQRYLQLQQSYGKGAGQASSYDLQSILGAQ